MSCVAGILERFYVIIGDAAFAMCPDEEHCRAENKDTYIKLFGKKIDKNELTQEWANEYLETPELRGMTPQQRKKHYIDFMKKKYNELNMLDEHTQGIIEREADAINYVFEELAFGGSKSRKRKSKKRKGGKRKNSKRKKH